MYVNMWESIRYKSNVGICDVYKVCAVYKDKVGALKYGGLVYE